MSSKPNPIAEQNLIFAGLGLQLGILSKDKVIRAFTEWLFDKSKPLADILIQQKALSSEEANSLKLAVQAHIQIARQLYIDKIQKARIEFYIGDSRVARDQLSFILFQQRGR